MTSDGTGKRRALLSIGRAFVELNRRLARRIRKRRFYYLATVLLALCITAGYWIFILFTDALTTVTDAQVSLILGLGASIVLIFDLFFILNRLQKRALIEPYHFALFPLGRCRLIQFLYVSLLADAKSLVYLATLLVFSAYFVFHGGLIPLLLCWLFLLLFFAAVVTWMAVFSMMAIRYVPEARENLVMLIPLLVLLFNVMAVTQSFHLIAYVPLISSFGAGIHGIMIQHTGTILLHLAYLSIGLGLGVGILYVGIHASLFVPFGLRKSF